MAIPRLAHDVEIDRPAATREVTDGRSNRDVANPKLGMHAPDEIVVSAHHAGGNPKAIVQRNLQLVTETNPPGNRFEDPPNCFNGCRLHGGAPNRIKAIATNGRMGDRPGHLFSPHDRSVSPPTLVDFANGFWKRFCELGSHRKPEPIGKAGESRVHGVLLDACVNQTGGLEWN